MTGVTDRGGAGRAPDADPGGAGVPRDAGSGAAAGPGAAGPGAVAGGADPAAPSLAEPHWLNLPNLLTFLRALLVPVILWLISTDREGVDDTARWWAFGIFVFAAATDSIDGWVARRWHGVTRWGQLADPIADKLLIVGSLASLALVGDLPWWAVNVIVAREIAVTLLRVRLVTRSGRVIAASAWGKLKTVSQVIAVAAFLLPGTGRTLPLRLLDVAVLLTIWSGFDYAFRVGRQARATRGGREDVG